MVHLSNANSLLELAFGLNAIGLALGERFVVARDDVVDAVRGRIQHVDKSFLISPEDEDVFSAFAADFSWGVRWASALRPLPQLLSLVAVLASVVGLSVSAVKPDRLVEDQLIFWFAFVTLILLPLAYTFYQRFLDWVVTRLAADQLRTESSVIALRDRFLLVRSLVHLPFKGTEVALASVGQSNRLTLWLANKWLKRWVIRFAREHLPKTGDA